MSLFDAAFDQMSWSEVSYRLPGNLAISALKRRITNLDTLLLFFDACGVKSNSVKELKVHINNILNGYSATDILDKFDEKHHSILFGWVDETNKTRLKTDGRAAIPTKLLFNMTNEKDAEGLGEVLDRILTAPELKQAAVISVLHKADITVFPSLINRVVRDVRPEVRCLVLAVGTEVKRKIVGTNMSLVGLKALSKSTTEGSRFTDILDFNLFSQLKPGERLAALKRYLGQFPLYHKVSVFDHAPTKDELDLVLFADCAKYNDLMIEIKTLYNQITQDDKPEEEEGGSL